MRLLQGHTNSIYALAFSPDGGWLASGGFDASVRLWDLFTGAEEECWREHKDRAVQALAFSPDGRYLVSGGRDRCACIWDVARRELLDRLGPLDGEVCAVTFSPDGKQLALGLNRGWPALRFFDAATRAEGLPFRNPEAQCAFYDLAFAPDGTRLGAVHGADLVIIWDRHAGVPLFRLRHGVPVHRVAFSPDGRLIATLPARTVQFWDAQTGEDQGTLTGHGNHIATLSFSPEGRFLATGGYDSTVRLWDVSTRRECARFDWDLGRIWAVAFAPDGMTAAAAGDRPDILLWDVAEV
jgi:WD40 repeat protein